MRCSSGVCSPNQPLETGKKVKGQIPLWVQIWEEEKKNPKWKATNYRNVDMSV